METNGPILSGIKESLKQGGSGAGSGPVSTLDKHFPGPEQRTAYVVTKDQLRTLITSASVAGPDLSTGE